MKKCICFAVDDRNGHNFPPLLEIHSPTIWLHHSFYQEAKSIFPPLNVASVTLLLTTECSGSNVLPEVLYTSILLSL